VKKLGYLLLLVPLLFLGTENHEASLEKKLVANWNDTALNFNDDHLTFRYAIEIQDPLPSPKDLEITYRKLDTYFALQMLEKGNKKIRKMIEISKSILNETAILWENESIKVSKNNYEGRIWLDTYCMLAWFTNNSHLKRNIADSLDYEKNLWIDDGLYTEGNWRQNSDEVWCIMALLDYNRTLSENLINIHLQEIQKELAFEEGYNKAATYLHSIMMLNYAKAAGFKGFEEEHQRLVEDSFKYLKSSGLISRLDLAPNFLWVYEKSGIKMKEVNDLKETVLKNSKNIEENYPGLESFIILQVLKALYV